MGIPYVLLACQLMQIRVLIRNTFCEFFLKFFIIKLLMIGRHIIKLHLLTKYTICETLNQILYTNKIINNKS